MVYLRGDVLRPLNCTTTNFNNFYFPVDLDQHYIKMFGLKSFLLVISTFCLVFPFNCASTSSFKKNTVDSTEIILYFKTVGKFWVGLIMKSGIKSDPISYACSQKPMYYSCFLRGRSLFISWGAGQCLVNPSFLRRPHLPFFFRSRHPQ